MIRENRLDPEGIQQAAEAVAVRALAFLAGRPEAIGRFLALAGIGPENLRTAARQPEFLAGVLDYLCSDEPLLFAFAEEAGFGPQTVAAARQRLAPSAET